MTEYQKVLKLKDGRYVRWQPPVGGPGFRPFHYWSPLDYGRWAFTRIATPLHFWRVRRYVKKLNANV